MKKILFAALCCCAMLIVSCKKENQSLQSNLFIGANFQNANWLATPATSYTANGDTLVVQGLHSQGDENLLFKINFSGVGVYKLTSANQASFYTGSANAKTSNYNLDVTQNNSVTVTGFNAATGIASGSFQLSFVKTAGNAAFSNTAGFSMGQFWIQLP